MAQKNRTEVKTELTNDITSTVTIAKLNGVLIDDLTESAKFRKDVVNTGSGNGAQALDYGDYDQIVFTATGNVTFSFSNLNDGDKVKLVVIKSAAYTIDFTGVNQIMESKTLSDTVCSYEIRKNSTYTYVTRIDRQYSGSKSISEFTISTGSLDALNYYNYRINDEILTLNGEIEVSGINSVVRIVLTGATADYLGKFINQDSYIAGTCSYDYAAQRGQPSTFTIYQSSSTGVYLLEFGNDQSTTFPSGTITFHFSCSVIIS